MSTVTLGGNPVHTNATLPTVGSAAPQFQLVGNDLSDVSLQDFKGQRVILNIFPSIDTATCATSVRTFNKMANDLENTKVYVFLEIYHSLKSVFVVLKV